MKTPGPGTPRPGLAPLLAPGDLVAGRFRIVRFLAAGGMGEVFEAHDQELDEPVALKTLRPELIADEEARERFRREVQLARRVSHPHVCRTFDVYRHPLGRSLPDGRPAELTLLTMELLAGETLDRRLARGPLSPAEALPLAGQMAEALQAAHDAGVVHRDFKSANVVLVPGENEIRAVVTDFGLARAVRQQLALTGSGALLGTPAYMAPEQLSASEVGPAADVYALGVVLFEMVTGARPFEGDTPFATALQRLAADPPSPRQLAPHLDVRWEATILRCLARDPGARFRSAADVPRALRGERLAFPAKWRPRWPLVGGLLVALAGGGAWLALRRGPAAPPLSAAPVALRPAVAVLGLRSLSGDPETAWLSTALAEMLDTELAAGGALRVVAGESVARMKSDLALPEADSLARDTLQRVRAHLGADLVVTGSYLAAPGGPLRVDVTVQDAASGEAVASVSEQGTLAGLLDVVSRTGGHLREGLGVTTAADAGPLRAAQVGSPEAARLYAEGLDRLRGFDVQAARERLERAVALVPDHPLPRAALAQAWAELGHDAKAREQAQAALPGARRLSREERLWVEGRAHEAAAEWDRAVEAYALLWDFFPDKVDYGLRLCAARIAQGRGSEALATAEALARLPAPLHDDPRISLCEAEAAQAVGDHRRQATASVEAMRRARRGGVRLVVAQARYLEAQALRGLGELVPALAAGREAEQLFAAAGDRSGAARAALVQATVLRRQGRVELARPLYERALELAREIGDRRRTSMALNGIASTLRQAGDFSGARQRYEAALAIDREVGDRRGEAVRLNNLGDLLCAAGDLTGALALLEASLSVARQAGDRQTLAVATQTLASTLLQRGQLAASREHAERALALARSVGSKRQQVFSLNGIAEVLAVQGDHEEARDRYQEALALAEEMGASTQAAETRRELALLALQAGRPGEAEPLARQAAEVFRTADQPEDEARALALLARARAGVGQPDALDVLAGAERLVGRSQHLEARLLVRIVAARLRQGSRPAEALAALDSVAAEAREAGWELLELEARLSAGELAARAGLPEARERLGAVAAAARRLGALGLARRASAATEG